jgi:copper chaperone CopZ
MSTSTITRRYLVPQVSCDHCKAAIEGEVGGVEGVTAALVDVAATSVTVSGGDDAAIRAAIDEAGYDVAEVVEVSPGTGDSAR